MSLDILAMVLSPTGQRWPKALAVDELATSYVVRADHTCVEVWSGKRIQPGNETKDGWQGHLKVDLREAFSRLTIPAGALLSGHYNSTSSAGDTENSLFTNMHECMPSAQFSAIRFERGSGPPPSPPSLINLVGGHLHYYRYEVGGSWTAWRPDQIVARWLHVPRKVSIGADTARPVWFALRQANAGGAVSVFRDKPLESDTPFGVRITVHTTPTGSHRPISNCEFVVDGSIAAFHSDGVSEELVAALAPRLPVVTEIQLRHALSKCAGPLFPTPAIRLFPNGSMQISPADDRCWLGEYTVCPDSSSRWPEFSGELFTITTATAAVESEE
jgi:hypothetical protein